MQTLVEIGKKLTKLPTEKSAKFIDNNFADGISDRKYL